MDFQKKQNWAVLGGVWCVSLGVAYWLGGGGDHGSGELAMAGGGVGAREVSGERAGVAGGVGEETRFGRRVDGSGSGRTGAGALAGLNGTARTVARLEQAAAIIGDEARDREIEAILAGLGSDELGDLLEGMDTEVGPVRSRLVREAVNRWATVDPVGALRFVESMDGEAAGEQAMLRDRVLTRWAEASPEAAWDWVLSNGVAETSERDLARVVAGSGEGDPARMFAFLEAHGPEFGKAQMGAVGAAVRDAYMNGFGDDVKAWVEGLGDGALRDAAVRSLADGMGRYDAEAAYAWASEMGLDEETLASVRGRLVGSWARTDPRGAAEFAAREGAESGSGRALEEVMRRWLVTDYEGAATWLAGQEPSPAMDRAMERYVYSAMRYDAAETWAWAEAITDEKRRLRAFEMLARKLRGADPAVLERTVLASDLSDAMKLKMLGVKVKEERPARPARPERPKAKVKTKAKRG